MPLLRLQSLSLERGGRAVVRSLSGEIAPGTLTAVVGPNGAGKSTLVEALAGRLAPREGRMERRAGLRVAHLPQQSALDRQFPIRVGDVVALGAWSRIGLWKALGGGLRREVDEALAAVGLLGCAQRPISDLSVGQFQRVLFARLLLQDADLILLDEPFNAVDEATTADLMALMQRWRDQGRAVVAVLHDQAQVRASFDRVCQLDGRGRWSWGTTTEVLAACAA
ncbi:MAG: hypothetical protein RLZZ592_1056 [Pseudomonadota bacterium]|jgi:zinc/manganese transport system ATP-binding protein|nr:zinc/manganese transport system ATP-binding protein [Pseudomonadota bacterium]